MKTISISLPRCEHEGSSTRISATIHADHRQFEIWYRVSEGPIADGIETFLAATLVPAMRLGCDIQVPGPVSPRLLQGLTTFQQTMHGWFPRLRPISILAKPKARTGCPVAGAASFFSGGVDAFYTLLKHHDEITKTVLIHGFDYQFNKTLSRETFSRLLQDAAAQLKRPLLEVDTNVRTFGDHYADWGYEYGGSVLASAALLLTPQFGKMYMASSYPEAYVFPWANHPDTDPLWSTEEIEIFHDGCEATRIEKVGRIAQCEPALKVLRVCWSDFRTHKRGGLNCGKCEKCIRTMADLRYAGALERCTTFRHKLKLRDLALIDLRHGHQHIFYETSLAEVQRSGKDPELARALRECVSQRHYRGLEGAIRTISTKLNKSVVRPALRPVERLAKRTWKRARLERG